MRSELEEAQASLNDLPKKIVELGLEAGATDVIGQVMAERTRMVRFSNNSITVVKTWDVVSPLVYLGWGNRNISCRLTDTSISTIEGTIRKMVSAVHALPESQVVSHLPRGPFQYKQVPDTYDPQIPELESELVDSVDKAINAAQQEGARRVSGVLSTYDSSKALMTSTGAHATTRQTMIEMSVRSFVEDDESGQGLSVATSLKDFDPVAAGRESGTFARMSQAPKPISEGKYNVVFGPSIFADLLSRVAFSSSAFAVDAGFSFFADKLGQQVASEQFTLLDDRLRPGGPGSIPFDDEGYPAQTSHIIEKGNLKTLVHDSRTAVKHKAALTGNATWIPSIGQIIPIVTSVVVEAGDRTRDELLEEAGEGLYLTNNWYTRFQNYRTGDFSTIPRDAGFMISNGKIAHPVKGIRISDNMLRLLKGIRALSEDRKWVRWWEVELPTLVGHCLVDQVPITKSTA